MPRWGRLRLSAPARSFQVRASLLPCKEVWLRHLLELFLRRHCEPLLVNMKTQLRITSTFAALILSTTVIAAASPKCRSSDFACFKRKMMPQVGRKITIVGMLASAKLGWIVTFEHWGVYVYNSHESDSARMKTLDSLNGQRVKLMGTLRYAPGSPSQKADAASVPEHFFFDVG